MDSILEWLFVPAILAERLNDGCAAAAYNNRKKDAPHCIFNVVASSRLVSLLDGTHVYSWTTKRDAFFAVDVICHCGGHRELVAIVSDVCYHFLRQGAIYE